MHKMGKSLVTKYYAAVAYYSTTVDCHDMKPQLTRAIKITQKLGHTHTLTLSDCTKYNGK